MGMRPPAQKTSVKASEIKAVFLFNFAQFVEWPENAFSTPGAPLIIGVLGKDPFGNYLNETVRGEAINGRPLIVRRFGSVSDIKACHVLFINQHSESLEGTLLSLKDKKILTVSDVPGFIERGGMIQFITENNKIRMRINPDAASASNLAISSKLLRLATIVTPGKE